MSGATRDPGGPPGQPEAHDPVAGCETGGQGEHSERGEHDEHDEHGDLAATYDLYYASRHYEHRYPVPNPATFDFLLAQGLHRARSVLDLGCGNGRYALALIERGAVRITGCDPSQGALDEFRRRLQGHPARSRIRLVHGCVKALAPEDRFDAILLLFGVLGLLGERERRVATLRALREHALPGARLALTVPSAWRRLPGARLQAWWRGLRDPSAASRSRDIRFERHFGGRAHHFCYHLYGAAELRQELAEGGWRLVLLEAESVLPESIICRHGWLARIDRRLRPWIPAFLGYGMRALAVPEATAEAGAEPDGRPIESAATGELSTMRESTALPTATTDCNR